MEHTVHSSEKSEAFCLERFLLRSVQRFIALLKRMRELDAEIAQLERNSEGEARLPIEEQLRLKLRRFLEASVPELAGKIKITSRAGS